MNAERFSVYEASEEESEHEVLALEVHDVAAAPVHHEENERLF